MKYQNLRQIKALYFPYDEVASVLNISPESAKVLVSRYYSKGLLVRLKRNLYVLREKWDYLDESEIMQVANVIQVPSYISLTSALSYYEITTQIQHNFLESIALNRSCEKNIVDSVFLYRKIASQYYFGFEKREQVFIAKPEKALVDALYFTAFGKYNLDIPALDLSKIDRSKMNQFLEPFPEQVIKLWRNYAAY